MQSFQSIGYNIKEAFSYEYEKDIFNSNEDVERGLNNTYILKNDQYNSNITLYYEPKIYSRDSKLDNGIELYRVTGRSFYIPDFLVKFNIQGYPHSQYGILDAKHSYFDALKDIYLKDECFKYIIGIGSKNTNYSALMFMWLLYPFKYYKWDYQTSKYCKQKKPIPSIGILSLSPEVDENKFGEFLQEQISDFLERAHSNIEIY